MGNIGMLLVELVPCILCRPIYTVLGAQQYNYDQQSQLII